MILLLLFVNPPNVFIRSSLELTVHLYNHYLELLIGIFLILTLLSSSSEALSYSFIWNIFLCCLILSSSLCLFVHIRQFVAFLDLGEVALFKRCLMGPSSVLPNCCQSYILWPLCRQRVSFSCGGPNYCGCASSLGWSPAQLAGRPCLVWRLPAAGG